MLNMFVTLPTIFALELAVISLKCVLTSATNIACTASSNLNILSTALMSVLAETSNLVICVSIAIFSAIL